MKREQFRDSGRGLEVLNPHDGEGDYLQDELQTDSGLNYSMT